MSAKRRDRVFWGWLLDVSDDGSAMEFKKRFVRSDGATILEIGAVKPASFDYSGVALPPFEDAHSHLADRGMAVAPGSTLADVVRPPEGIKHKFLASEPRERIVKNISEGLHDLISGGVTRTHEFREGGIPGVQMFREAYESLGAERKAHMTPVVLGRPASLTVPKGSSHDFFAEFNKLMAQCDGLGLSSISDGDADWNLEVARAACAKGKMVELHASEENREPIDKILESGASQVVHMTGGQPDDFQALAEAGVAVAVCTRSNEFFGVRANVRSMVEAGVEVRIGTDNAFLGAPDMFLEARAFARVHMHSAQLEPIQILASMLRRQGINEGGPIAPREGRRPDLMMLDIQTERPDRDLIARGSNQRVTAIFGQQAGSHG